MSRTTTQLVRPGAGLADWQYWQTLAIGVGEVSIAQIGSQFIRTFFRNKLLRGSPHLASAQLWTVSFCGALAFYGIHKLLDMGIHRERLGSFGENLVDFGMLWGMFGFGARFVALSSGAMRLRLGLTEGSSSFRAGLFAAEYGAFSLWETGESAARTAAWQVIHGDWNGAGILAAAVHPWSGRALIDRGFFLAGLRAGNVAFKPIERRLLRHHDLRVRENPPAVVPREGEATDPPVERGEVVAPGSAPAIELTFGSWLRAIRGRREPAEFCRLIGIKNPRYLARLEAGTSMPTLGILAGIVEARFPGVDPRQKIGVLLSLLWNEHAARGGVQHLEGEYLGPVPPGPPGGLTPEMKKTLIESLGEWPEQDQNEDPDI